MDNLISSTKAATGRLGLQMAGIFVVGFLALVVLLFVWDLFTSFSNPGDVGPSSAITAIDPKLEGELRTAIDFEGFKVPSDVKNPFTDRGGLTEVANAQGVTPPAGQTAAGGAPGTATTSGQTGSVTTPSDPIKDLQERYKKWEMAANLGLNPGPIQSVLSIFEVVPVGYVSGGSGGETILLFSPSLCETFRVDVGTKLYDGWLISRKGLLVQFVNLEKEAIPAKPVLIGPPKSECKKDKTDDDRR